MSSYLNVTELAGDDVSKEQVSRIFTRYVWAQRYCSDKNVVEVACGTGQGLQLLFKKCKSLIAGDIDNDLLAIAKEHNPTIDIKKLSAEELPFVEQSIDVLICFEAIYYFDFKKFLAEAQRVLRPGGKVLIASANPDLFDFNPSPHSIKYFGVQELNKEFSHLGFSTKFYADCEVEKASLSQTILRAIKKFVVSFGLMPKTMAGKKLLKRLVFGKLVTMPPVLKESDFAVLNYPEPISASIKNTTHKVIFCEATKE